MGLVKSLAGRETGSKNWWEGVSVNGQEREIEHNIKYPTAKMAASKLTATEGGER